jgi:hypothetical protein
MAESNYAAAFPGQRPLKRLKQVAFPLQNHSGHAQKNKKIPPAQQSGEENYKLGYPGIVYFDIRKSSDNRVLTWEVHFLCNPIKMKREFQE